MLLSLFPLRSVAEFPGLPPDLATIEGMPMPHELLGFEPGQRHPQHHELLHFYRELARVSDRVSVETIGRSSGGREQILVYFSTPKRLADLDQLRAGRIDASRNGDGPLVAWLGYSVHGNEASGASAAPLVAWYLATSSDDQVVQWLDQMMIVMEPAINPDGLDRFAHWTNMHSGRNPSSDPNDREHNEDWPNGRTSYYWFDLNRDWMPLTHPVSRQRIAHYARWRPHVLTDTHEMGHGSTYFFQPGVPERNHPDTPERLFELTRKLGEYHGEVLDKAGEPYYSRESFDDYYLGKGSTYPDLTGGLGILFEQGSARGQRMQTPFGERTFTDAIANQVRTSISTLNGTLALADDLVAYQADFFREARTMGGRGGWLIGDDGDPARARRLLEILLGHGIDVRAVTEPVTIAGVEHDPGSAWAVPAGQDQYRFIRAIFATPTELPMETFYDVSAWPLQHAFDLPFRETAALPDTGDSIVHKSLPTVAAADIDAAAIAWAIAWDQHNAPAVLADLLDQGYRAQAAQKPVTLATASGNREFVRGSIIVHSGIQPDDLPPVNQALASIAGNHGVAVASIASGLARQGIDLGSPNAPVLEKPTPLLLTGPGVRSYAAGYVWRWFDLLLDQPITQIDTDSLPSDLGSYSHIIMPSGVYGSLPESFGEQLSSYVEQGGQIIALGSAASWVESLDLGWSFVDTEADTEGEQDESINPPAPKAYEDFEQDFARTLIGGSALDMQLDTSHPLGYGYERSRITVFRQGAHVLKRSENRYATPGNYNDQGLLAGYLSEDLADQIAGSPALAADRLGPGLVVRIADDYLFRAYWAGTERLIANALFFGQLIESTRLPEG
ncbi:MAG: M14 family metallopeptidase [Wenzhouxiangellaceae bacterium]|nr:M14 family metallopeptidase [Wenzhouxiangellaceae bacterium]